MQFLIPILMFVCFICTTPTIQQEQPIIQAQEPSVEEIERTTQTNYTEIGNSIGVIILNDNYSEKDTVKIYNNDGSLWYKFTYYYDDSDGKFDYPNDEFRPRAFNPDYFTLGMEIVKEFENGYEVIVNGQTGLKKRVRKEHFLKMLTWDQYVLNAFSVCFNEKQNPIRKNPNDKDETIIYEKDNTYHPEKIQDDWLQIRWGEEKNWNYGWIKWKKEKQLLIEIYLYA